MNKDDIFTQEAVSELVNNRKNLTTESFLVAMGSILNKYQSLQAERKKGPLAHIYVSLLRTAVIERSTWYRIDLFDDQELFDIEDCSIRWDFSAVSDKVYKAFDVAAGKSEEKIPSYEWEDLVLQCAQDVHEALKSAMPAIMVECQPLMKQESVGWHFGEYLADQMDIKSSGAIPNT